MNALTTLPLEGKQLELIRRTVAADCNAAEFDQFIHICKAVRLDPLRRQIYAFVFGKNNPQYRRMSVITGIDGYRAIAERTQNYRPDPQPPRIVYDDAAKDPQKNPLGIVRAEITVFKFAHGAWFPVAGEAYWDEYAPFKDGILDPKKDNWRKMARVMISKCAEAQAIRRAWPDDFSGLEVEEEVDRRASLDLTATEEADQIATERRFNAIGGANAVTVDWLGGDALTREPVGTFGDKVLAFLNENAENTMTVRAFQNRNEAALKEYWAHDKSGGLALKKAFEAVFASEAAE